MQLFLSSLTYINTNICFQENGKTPETVFHSLLFFGRKLSPFQKIFVKFCIFFQVGCCLYLYLYVYVYLNSYLYFMRICICGYLLIVSDNFVPFLEFFKLGAAACLSYSLKRCWLHVSLGKNGRNFPLTTRDESHKFINVFSQIAQCLMLDKKGENEENCKKTMSKFLPTFHRCRWEAAKIKDLKTSSSLFFFLPIFPAEKEVIFLTQYVQKSQVTRSKLTEAVIS